MWIVSTTLDKLRLHSSGIFCDTLISEGWVSRFSPKDAVLVARKQLAMEASRKRMQEELDAKAAIFREKQREVQ